MISIGSVKDRNLKNLSQTNEGNELSFYNISFNSPESVKSDSPLVNKEKLNILFELEMEEDLGSPDESVCTRVNDYKHVSSENSAKVFMIKNCMLISLRKLDYLVTNLMK